MAPPGVVRECVAEWVRSGEVDAGEPVTMGRRHAAGLELAKPPEAASDVVEHTVEDHADDPSVAGGHERGERIVVPEPPVHVEVVGGVVAVRRRLEERTQVERVHAERAPVVDPVVQPGQPWPRRTRAVVCRRGPAEAERIDVVEDGIRPPAQGHVGRVVQSIRSRKAAAAASNARAWSMFAAWPAPVRTHFAAPGILAAMYSVAARNGVSCSPTTISVGTRILGSESKIRESCWVRIPRAARASPVASWGPAPTSGLVESAASPCCSSASALASAYAFHRSR